MTCITIPPLRDEDMTMRGSHVSPFTTTIVPHQPLARAVIRVGRLSVAVGVRHARRLRREAAHAVLG